MTGPTSGGEERRRGSGARPPGAADGARARARPGGAARTRGRGRPGALPGPAALIAVSALAWLAGTVPASAQRGGDAPGDEGWLGVGLRQSVQCRARMQARPDGTVAPSEDSGCTPHFVVEAVVEDAPADRAGVRPGDTLVAVNGRALLRASGREEFVSLDPGRPAQVLIGRPGEGRISMRVIPGRRPREVAPSRVLTAEPPDAPEPPVIFSPRAVEAPARPPDAPAAGPDRRWPPGTVVVGQGEDGRIVLRWGSGDSAVVSRPQEVAPRLEAIRDSVFAQARRHLRALSRQRGRDLAALQRRLNDELEDGARAIAEAGEAAEGLRGLLRGAESVRAAGAEFRPLNPALADYFPGADRGLLVMEVVSGTPAEELGLRPGDVVVEAGGRPVAGAGDLREALAEYPRRDSLVVKWIRKGDERTGVLKGH